MPIYRDLDHNFFKKWSTAMAYVLGFFAADGSMLKNNRGAHFVEFTITDRIVLELIQKVTRSTHKITERKRKKSVWKPQYRLQIGSKEWFTDLAFLGFTQNKSNTLRFPKVPREYLGDFIRGYFDGDGCVYFNKLKFADRKYKCWVMLTLFTSGSEGFLRTLQKKLKTLGVTGGSLRKKNRGFDLAFSHRDSLVLYRVMYHTGEASNLFLPRKRKRFERAMKVVGIDK